MLANAKELYSWIEQGAYLYICGDAKRMAKDVDAALQTIVENEGNMSQELAKAFLKKLRVEDKRYLRDIY
jgi:sulfite reductase (NADPH) flavoprotein alpha-component